MMGLGLTGLTGRAVLAVVLARADFDLLEVLGVAVALSSVTGGGFCTRRMGRAFHVIPASMDLYIWWGLAASKVRSSSGSPVIVFRCTPPKVRMPFSWVQDSPRSELTKSPVVSPS